MTVYSVVILCFGMYLLMKVRERALACQSLNALLASVEEEDQGGPQEGRKDGSWSNPTTLIFYGIGALVFWGVRCVVSEVGWVEQVLYLGLGVIAGEMAHRVKNQRARNRESKATDFFLPVVMERVVMAVSAGLDILPALSDASRAGVDPVSKLFSRVIDLVNRGISVEDALKSIADGNEAPAVKHAFTHLALAHKEGGELVRPLRELSDATQLHYQEMIEEEIAKLPVKAVLPLVLTFTGLIVCFLTVPLVQVSSLTGKVAQGVMEQ
jgi:Flp pilus assembly protein TadB